MSSKASEVFSRGVEIEFEDRTIIIPRLGLQQIQDFSVIVDEVMSLTLASKGIISSFDDSPDMILQVLAKAYRQASSPLLDFLSNLLGVSSEDLLDGSKFPLPLVMRIIKGIASHPDVNDFFAEMSDLQNLQTDATTSIKSIIKDNSASSSK